jgi:maleylacetoacetate isomerase
MIFYSNWRSLAAYRVRVALAMKKLPHELVTIDMLGGEHHGAAFKSVNPQGVIPALRTSDGQVLMQSLAILEYLDEIAPTPALLPPDAAGRARVRGLALIHAADSHPLLVPRVRAHLQKDAGLDDAAVQRWVDRALHSGLEAIEQLLSHSPETGQFCHGDQPTMADITLMSHLLAMGFFQCNTSAYPTANRIARTCEGLEAFAMSHPLKQLGAPTP